MLPRSFGAFLGRFSRLSPVQELAIEPLLEGHDALLVSPTASGKTEAYAAPLAERLLGSARTPSRPHTLIVSPTRALANDLYRRLSAPFDSLDIPFGRYTGEHKQRVDGRLPCVAVTTPEALDSLLARRTDVLRGVRAVVLDELHVLDGTPRGDQLRILIQRLAQTAEAGLQRVGASATVSDPHGVAARYLGDAVVIQAPGRREIRAKMFPGRTPRDVAEHLRLLAESGFRKILVFARSRNDVESITAYLSKNRGPFRDCVFPHHGSLSRTVREQTEERFLNAPAAVAVATLTLELGIDIGGVDYVLLCGPPSSVASLLQRIGRGNRRARTTRVGCACASVGEELVFRVQLERAAAGDLCADPYAFRPGVLVQQAVVLACAEGEVTAERVHRILPDDLKAVWSVGELEMVLERAAEKGLLEPARSDRYVPSERSERLYEQGRLHSNIDEPGEILVEDRLTGEVIGAVAGTPGGRGERIEIGGRTRQVAHVSGDRILTDRAREGGPARFATRAIPPVSFALSRAIAERVGAEPDELLQARCGDGWLLIHGIGSCGARLVADYLRQKSGSPPLRVSPFAMLLAERLASPPNPSLQELRTLLHRREQSLARSLGMGPYHRYLPPEGRRAALADAAWVAGIARFLQRAGLREIAGPAPETWRCLL